MNPAAVGPGLSEADAVSPDGNIALPDGGTVWQGADGRVLSLFGVQSMAHKLDELITTLRR